MAWLPFAFRSWPSESRLRPFRWHMPPTISTDMAIMGRILTAGEQPAPRQRQLDEVVRTGPCVLTAPLLSSIKPCMPARCTVLPSPDSSSEID